MNDEPGFPRHSRSGVLAAIGAALATAVAGLLLRRRRPVGPRRNDGGGGGLAGDREPRRPVPPVLTSAGAGVPGE